MANDIVLSTAYFPPIQYVSKIIHADCIFIEAYENYSRQSYRNRCNILSCNGVLSLTIPIKKGTALKEKITEVRIDYSVNWQRSHLNAIISAYGKSPFFKYYSDDILEPIYRKHDSLFDLNNSILNALLLIIQTKKNITPTTSFIKKYDESIFDYRNSINPKKNSISFAYPVHTYIQTFSDRFEFIPNLSILDLIFNMGPESKSFLLKI